MVDAITNMTERNAPSHTGFELRLGGEEARQVVTTKVQRQVQPGAINECFISTRLPLDKSKAGEN